MSPLSPFRNLKFYQTADVYLAGGSIISVSAWFNLFVKNMSQNQWSAVVGGVLYKYCAECATKPKRWQVWQKVCYVCKLMFKSYSFRLYLKIFGSGWSEQRIRFGQTSILLYRIFKCIVTALVPTLLAVNLRVWNLRWSFILSNNQ